MPVLYATRQAVRQGGPVRLILLKKVWHVVARGYVCRGDDVEEGRGVMATLQSSRHNEDALR